MDPPPFPKRSLRPTASLPPTTAEFYGEKHGIDPAVQLALQNIGRRSRQNVSQPSFQRTSTAPVSFNAPSFGSSSRTGSGPGFQTSHEIMAQAKGIVNKEAWRMSTRELQPYGSGSGSDIGEEREGDIEAGPGGSGGVRGVRQDDGVSLFGMRDRERGTKRTNLDHDHDQDEGEGEGDEEGTEVDEDEQPPSMEDDQQPGSANAGGADEFPPVFQSPHLSQPELFHRPFLPSQTQTRTNQVQSGRQMRGLPSRPLGGRGLGKTVSAPVGSLWSANVDVDMDMGSGGGDGGGEEDGFDISEWAKEEF